MTVGSDIQSAIDSLEQAIDELKSEARHALDTGRMEDVKAIADRVEFLQGVVDSLSDAVGTEPDHSGEEQPDAPDVGSRRNFGRLPPGMKTQQAEFRAPILRALTGLGGEGTTSDVLDEVGRIMHSRLQPIDHEALKSTPDEPRWRNTAQWARLAMVREGLLRPDSPRGRWEITSDGRAWLERESRLET